MFPKHDLVLKFLVYFAVANATAAASSVLFSVVRSPGFWSPFIMVAAMVAAAMTWITRNRPWVVQEQEPVQSEPVPPAMQ